MSGSPWHNHIPQWVLVDMVDMADNPLRQGPRATLQAMANKCDERQTDWEGEPLLVCIGGDKLIARAGCSRGTFWEHLRILIARGYVVQLSRGGGRLASAYGVPGERGQLDPYRIQPGDKVRKWAKEDSARIRGLVSGNRTLAEGQGGPAGTRTPAAQESDATHPKTGRHAPGNRTLPSSSHPPEPSPEPSRTLPEKEGVQDDGDAARLLVRLEEIRFGTERKRVKLIRDHPRALSEAFVKLDQAVAEGKGNGHPVRNPGGMLHEFLQDIIGSSAYEQLSRAARAKAMPEGAERRQRKNEIVSRYHQAEQSGSGG